MAIDRETVWQIAVALGAVVLFVAFAIVVSAVFSANGTLSPTGGIALVGSIAGGRKTMSAHLMTAFSVYARPQDRLTHVLVADASLENDDSFFYPKPGDPRYGHLLDLVTVRFPRLRPVLSNDVIEGVPDDRRDLEGILNALQPQVASIRDVNTVRVELRDQSARLVFLGMEGKAIDTCALTTTQAATLLAFAEARAAAGEAVPNTALPDRDAVEARRNAVRWICSQPELTPWTSTDDVSKAISALNRALSSVPVAERLLYGEGLSINPRQYDWPGETPPLTVAARHPDENWPFNHVPSPERL